MPGYLRLVDLEESRQGWMWKTKQGMFYHHMSTWMLMIVYMIP